MRKKTYRAFIIIASIVVLIAIALAVKSQYEKHKEKFENSTFTEEQQVSNESGTGVSETIPPSSIPAVPSGSTFAIHFFDVGEADAALVECDSHFMLIDGGNPSSSSFLYSYLQQYGIDYLDYIVCSHAHTDHVGGLAGALNYASVGTAYAPVTEYDSRAFNSLIKYLDAQGKEILIPSPGDTIELGCAVVTFIGPIDMSLAEGNDNNSSIILRIEYGDTSFLFTGDAEIEEELSVLQGDTTLQSTVLKVGHHGSYTSSSAAFLAAVDPDYAVISVGKDNEYGHPHDSAIERIDRYCDAIYRTDQDGEILCSSDGLSLTFSCSK